MEPSYVHGYDTRETIRLQDQASTLAELLHADTRYPAGSRVLEAGCGVGAQTVTLARNSPDALITSIDIAEASLAEARRQAAAAGARNVSRKRLPWPPAPLLSATSVPSISSARRRLMASPRPVPP